MRSLSEMQKPASGKTGFHELSFQIHTDDSSENLLQRQAYQLAQRFAVTPPIARCIAELHYGRTA